MGCKVRFKTTVSDRPYRDFLLSSFSRQRLKLEHIGVAQTISAILDQQIGEIDVHRQSRQVTDKEVDRCPALECEAGFQADELQQLDQHDQLSIEPIISAQHQNAPAR